MNKIILFFIITLFVVKTKAQPGFLDNSFGTSGRVTTSFGTNSIDMAEDIAIQSDGKIIAVGHIMNPSTGLSEIALSRCTGTGSLDTGFGTTGKTTTTVVSGFNHRATGVKLQSDGKIVVSAEANDSSTISPANGYFIILRYNVNGTLDNTFGVGGIAAVQMTAAVSPEVAVTDLIIQADGKIVICGEADMSGMGDLVFLRMNSSGTIDPSFSVSGISVITLSALAWPEAMVLQPDGKIAFAGAFDFGSTNGAIIGRLNSNGTVDSIYGTLGVIWVSYGASSAFFGIQIQPDGKLVTCGFDTNGALLARFSSSGAVDLTFSGTGNLITPIGSQNDARFGDLAIQPDGKIVAGGGADTTFALGRVSGAGVLDATFGIGGIVQTPFNQSYMAEGKGLALQSDGKIVLGGYMYSTVFSTPAMFALARYNGDPLSAIKESLGDYFISVFPNPTEGEVYISCDKPCRGNLINCLGQYLITIEVSAGTHEIDMSSYPPGMYSLELYSGESRILKKIVLQ